MTNSKNKGHGPTSQASIDIPGRQERFGFGGGWGAHTLILPTPDSAPFTTTTSDSGKWFWKISKQLESKPKKKTWILICRNAGVLTIDSYSCTLQFWPWDFSNLEIFVGSKKTTQTTHLLKAKSSKLLWLQRLALFDPPLTCANESPTSLGLYTVLGPQQRNLSA